MLVSCLMVTRRSRLELAKRAIDAFDRQTYRNRELVIVANDNIAELGRPWHPSDRDLLGELRNHAVGCAKGQIVAQWDDDDISHPERLKVQIEAMFSSGRSGCILSRIMLLWPERRLVGISHDRNWECTMVAYRKVLKPYPPVARGEDTPVVHELNAKRICEPWLYTRHVHGANTWPREHFDRMFEQAIWKTRMRAPGDPPG